jgi:DNA-binding transcriptional MerR regulator
MDEKPTRSIREGLTSSRRDKKIFYTISEVSSLVGVKPYVLRYWETEFPILKPQKSDTGHRLYRQDDIDIIVRIKRLLYDKCFTIQGAKRILSHNNTRRSELEQLRSDIQDILDIL